MYFYLFLLQIPLIFGLDIEFRFNAPPFSQGLDLPLLQAIKEGAGETCQIRAGFYELTYRPLVQALVASKQRGCEVAVLLEQDNIKKVTQASDRDYAPWEAVELLTESGVLVVTDRLLGKGSGKSHNKLVSVSPDFVFSGSMNATSHGLIRSQNHVMMLRDKSVYALVNQELQHLLDGGVKRQDKSRQAPKPLHIAGTEISLCLAPNPVCFFRLKQALYEAKSEILGAMFSLTDPEILQILKAKQEAGISVEVLLDDMAAGVKVESGGLSKIPLRDWLNLNNIAFRVDGKKGLMHHKLAILDRKTVITGSANWSQSAFRKNDENIWILRSKKVAQNFLDAGAKDLFVGSKHPLVQPTATKLVDSEILAVYPGREVQVLCRNCFVDLRPTIFLENQKTLSPVSCQDWADTSICRFKKVPKQFLVLLEDKNQGILDLYYQAHADSALFQMAEEILKPQILKAFVAQDSCQEKVLPGLWQKCREEILNRFVN